MTLPVQARPAEGAGRRALLLAFAAVVMTLVLPLAGLVMSVFALVASIRAIKALRSVTKPVGIAVSGIILSAIALLICLSVTILQFYFSKELSSYTECRRGAGTVTSQNECVDQLERAMEKRLGFLQPGEIQFPFPP
ncbi:hypothetical protein [Streptosporangium sp. 'caverna']|uniref:hypothetical protein n=1 Tax=Streptosporangium sp. 'caverna' TaxID=2202249 RepID=UPI000D7E99D9|nr:hypothetical protein [Streptosporangium sp. 'caverna']AWS40703.1 hypothetical protein DKM19_04425 [Streptosporangium sp. 'caverna']